MAQKGKMPTKKKSFYVKRRVLSAKEESGQDKSLTKWWRGNR